MLLLEQVDRLTRLTEGDWQRLLGELKSREIQVVSIDLPTSWMMPAPGADEFTNRMFAAVNRMLLEVLAATARKDYEDRRRRQALCSRRRELERHSGRNRLQPCNHRQDRARVKAAA
jgi:DNA invertase Pin-like site-specific DNA recombinase